MIHADTDGLLDKCHCGAVAGFMVTQSFALGVRHSARCTDCHEQTNWKREKRDTIIEWNLARRAEKEKVKS